MTISHSHVVIATWEEDDWVLVAVGTLLFAHPDVVFSLVLMQIGAIFSLCRIYNQWLRFNVSRGSVWLSQP